MIIAALALGAGAFAYPARAATLKTVAVQNTLSPEMTFAYRKFGDVAISDASPRRAAVFAQLRGAKCLFKLDPDGGPGATVACQRGPTPDGRAFGNLGVPSINVAGEAGLASRVTQGRTGVYRGDPTVVATTGDAVPAPGSGLMKTLSFGRITDAGDVAFESTISGGAVVLGVEVNQGIFRCDGGNGNCSVANGGTGVLTTLALVNDAVPDRAGREFCAFEELAASSFGIAFRASTKLDCANNAELEAVGVFRQPVGGPIQTIALQGEASNPFPAPGGTTYLLPQAPTIANTGIVAFQASTTGILATTVLYRCAPATCPASPADDAVSAGETDGPPDNNLFVSFFTAPGVNDAGDIVFDARIRQLSGVHQGIYIKRAAGALDVVARTGDLSSIPAATFFDFAPPAMSPGGKVVFPARVKQTASPHTLRAVFAFE